MNANTTINKNFLIVLLGILAALGPFTIDMYLPGFKQIALDLRTDEKHVAFTLTSYFVGIAVGQLFYGPIVDKYGRKRPLLFGLFIYALSALGCAFSPSIQTMIGMRLLQALGGCVGMVAANAIISDVYEVNQRAKAFSTMILIMGVAPLVAPSIGSFFVEQANWQYIFYFLTLFAFLVGLLIYFFLPETSLHMHSNKLKIKTIGKDYLTILKTKIFFRYIVAGSLSMAILFAYISSASFIFLTHYALSKTTFSILFAINASGLILGSYLNGLLTNYVNYVTIARRASIILGIITFLLLVLIYLKPNLPYQYMVGGLF
ncbi:MAG: multidrug effflux MFS transporter, partial [Flavobacteriaceae bacterium]|nr:multidrug effflux MFS transporter [Flavobacteriaceae bacterium]